MARRAYRVSRDARVLIVPGGGCSGTVREWRRRPHRAALYMVKTFEALSRTMRSDHQASAQAA